MHTSLLDDSGVIGARDWNVIPMIDHREADHVTDVVFAGGVWGRPPGKKGVQLLGGMVRRRSVCLRRLARGRRREIVAFHRFLSNPQVSVERLIEAWGEPTSLMCADRHVLAIQDTSEVKFRTGSESRRGLGPAGKGNCYGLLLHAMLAVDAETGACLGLAGGRIWTRDGVATRPDVNSMAAELRKNAQLLFPGWESGKRVPQDGYKVSRAA